jgi:hypothetical protein
MAKSGAHANIGVNIKRSEGGAPAWGKSANNPQSSKKFTRGCPRSLRTNT